MKLILCLLIIGISSNVFSQVSSEPNIVGVQHKIESKILKEEREILVHLPQDYETSNMSYPVVYVLDGQRFFLHTVSSYQTFSSFDLTPEFIIVGITNVQSKRMRTFSSGGEGFRQFLSTEVIPMIDQHYRTADQRLLFGWAYGGGFGLKTLMETPDLFNGYILSSPFPVSSQIESMKVFLEQNRTKSTYLFYTADNSERGVIEGVNELNQLLSKTPNVLRWKFKELQGEGHRSTPFPTIYHGIMQYFDGYRELRFKSLDEFNTLGGLSYFNEYYKTRHERYGKHIEPALFTKFGLVRLSIRENNYEVFKILVQHMGGQPFIADLRASRACEVADFYVKNGDNNKAKEIFSTVLKNNEGYERAIKGLEQLNE